MSLDLDVLRALLRLARRRISPTLAQLTVRVRGEAAEVRRALVTLANRGLVQRTPAGLRLSLAGLAVAVAFAQHAATNRTRVRGAQAGRKAKRSLPERAVAASSRA